LSRAVESFDAVIVGGGQAGLCTSYFLSQQSVSHVVLERHGIGDSWQSRRWHAFKFNTPNYLNALPGAPYRGSDPAGFSTNREFVRYLEHYAETFALPVRTACRVQSAVSSGSTPRFRLSIEDGGDTGTIYTDNIVAATGGFIEPKVPALAGGLPPTINQLTAATYRSADTMEAGGVLVVGSGDSGAQIAEDLAGSGRAVYLATSERRRFPRRYRGKDFTEWSVDTDRWNKTVDTLKDPLDAFKSDAPLATGVGPMGHTLSYQALERKGVVLLGRLESITGDHLRFDDKVNDYVRLADDSSAEFKTDIDAFIRANSLDAPPPEADPDDEPDTLASSRPIIEELRLSEKNITHVIWCGGFTHGFGWLKMPVFDEHGYPEHVRGVTDVDGVYFIGLHWLHRLASGLVWGVSSDGKYLAEQIARGLC